MLRDDQAQQHRSECCDCRSHIEHRADHGRSNWRSILIRRRRLLAFWLLFFSRHPQTLLGQVLRPDPTPVGFVPIVGRTIARRGGERLKADGKLKVTGSDGLQNSTSLMRQADRARLPPR